MVRPLYLLLVASACNQVYDLQATTLPDAAIDANCAEVTPDEDGDCLANVADNCPGLANTDQADADADGVGDVCDPRPTNPGDRIVDFQPFDDISAGQQQWRDIETEWKFEPGQVRHENVADSFSAIQIAQPVPLDALVIEIGMRIDELPLSTVDRHIEPKVDHPNLDISGGHYCTLVRSPVTPVGAVNASLQDAGNGEGNRLQIDDPPVGHVVVIQFARVADSEIRCRVHDDGTLTDVGKRIRTSTWPRTGYFSLYIRNIAVSMLWSTLYTQ